MTSFDSGDPRIHERIGQNASLLLGDPPQGLESLSAGKERAPRDFHRTLGHWTEDQLGDPPVSSTRVVSRQRSWGMRPLAYGLSLLVTFACGWGLNTWISGTESPGSGESPPAMATPLSGPAGGTDGGEEVGKLETVPRVAQPRVLPAPDSEEVEEVPPKEEVERSDMTLGAARIVLGYRASLDGLTASHEGGGFRLKKGSFTFDSDEPGVWGFYGGPFLVEVLGTAFTMSFSEESGLSVRVTRGKVKVSRLDQPDGLIILEAGKELAIRSDERLPTVPHQWTSSAMVKGAVKRRTGTGSRSGGESRADLSSTVAPSGEVPTAAPVTPEEKPPRQVAKAEKKPMKPKAKARPSNHLQSGEGQGWFPVEEDSVAPLLIRGGVLAGGHFMEEKTEMSTQIRGGILYAVHSDWMVGGSVGWDLSRKERDVAYDEESLEAWGGEKEERCVDGCASLQGAKQEECLGACFSRPEMGPWEKEHQESGGFVTLTGRWNAVKGTHLHVALEMDAGLALESWSFVRYQKTETGPIVRTDESSLATGLYTGLRPIVEIPLLGGRLPLHLAAEVSHQWMWAGRPVSVDMESLPASTWSAGAEVGMGVRF